MGSGSINQAARDVNIYNRPEAVSTIPRQLPHDIPQFTGRHTELAELDSLLKNHEAAHFSAPRIMALVGTAGVGKTALIIHWANRVRNHFPDGDLYVDLHGYHTGLRMSAEAVLEGFLRAIAPDQVLPSGLEPLAALYRSRVSDRRMLIILDNAAAPDDIRSLLPGSSDSLVLITSRSNLSGLGVRDGINRMRLDPLPPQDAGTLLRKIIGEHRADAESKAIAELARLSVYLPLTLRIAAGRAATQSHKSLMQLVEDLNHHRLDVFSTPDHDQTTAVRSVFSWSLRELPDAEARMFRLLGLHAGPDISIAAAAALAATNVYGAEQLLEALVEVNLLKREGSRYRFHDLLAMYALECAETTDTTEVRTQALRRVLLWYLHTVDSAEHLLSKRSQRVDLEPLALDSPPLKFSTQDDALNWCEAERVNLIAATRQAIDIHENEIAWKLPNTLWGFLYRRRYWEDWINTHLVALAAAQELEDQGGEAWTLGSLAMAYRFLRRSDEAIEHLDRAIAIARATGWRWGEGVGLTILGAVYYDLRRQDQGSFAQAIDLLQNAQEIFRDIGDRWGEGFALNNLGGIYRYQGNLERSLDCLRLALEIRQVINDEDGEGDTLTELGDLFCVMREYETALSYFQKAMDIRLKTNNLQGEAYTLRGIGMAQQGSGLFEDARRSWHRALAIFEESGNPRTADIIELLTGVE